MSASLPDRAPSFLPVADPAQAITYLQEPFALSELLNVARQLLHTRTVSFSVFAMQLYLIRHAHALAEEIDPDRPLSPKGRAQIKQLARFLQAKSAFAPAELWHSPLARSRQTARLLAGAVSPAAKISEIPHLEPEAKPSTIAARLKTLRRDLAIVGHEPHLSSLAALLVTGTIRADVFKIRKSAVLCLDRSGPQAAFWRVRWLLAPELLD